jgi:hypothetical protein
VRNRTAVAKIPQGDPWAGSNIWTSGVGCNKIRTLLVLK